MKVGIYYAYWTHNWDVDFLPYVKRAAALGFDVLEVNAGTIANMTPPQRRELRRAAVGEGIELSYCIGLTEDYDVASSIDAVRQRGVKFLQAMTEAVGEMGGGPLSGIIYGAWPGTMPDGEIAKRPYLERSIASLKHVAPTAESSGVVLNVEVVNRFEQFLLNTAEEGVSYVNAVDSPAVKVLLDTFHMNIEEDSIGDAVRRAATVLGHVHVGENNRKPPGRGHIPWEELGRALREVNYEGYVVMEPFLMPGGEIGRDIRVYRDLRGGVDLDTEAQRACEFVRRTVLSG